jgi:hypothetical protein
VPVIIDGDSTAHVAISIRIESGALNREDLVGLPFHEGPSLGFDIRRSLAAKLEAPLCKDCKDDGDDGEADEDLEEGGATGVRAIRFDHLVFSLLFQDLMEASFLA